MKMFYQDSLLLRTLEFKNGQKVELIFHHCKFSQPFINCRLKYKIIGRQLQKIVHQFFINVNIHLPHSLEILLGIYPET